MDIVGICRSFLAYRSSKYAQGLLSMPHGMLLFESLSTSAALVKLASSCHVVAASYPHDYYS